MRLVSDFKVVLSAPGATGGKDGAALDANARDGISVSIINSSSPSASPAVGHSDCSNGEFALGSPRSISSSSFGWLKRDAGGSAGNEWEGFLRGILLRVFLAFVIFVASSSVSMGVCVTTMIDAVCKQVWEMDLQGNPVLPKILVRRSDAEVSSMKRAIRTASICVLQVSIVSLLSFALI